MKDLITITIVGVLLWWVMIWPQESKAVENIKEMSMKTDVGEVVLTTEDCIFIKMGLKDYPYAAYATEKGKANHEGCWRRDDVNGMSTVLIYFPEIDSTAVYNPQLFSPRQKPTVYLDPKIEYNQAMLYGVYTF
jgi:hypothetical protein